MKHHVLLKKLISFKQKRLMPETVLWENWHGVKEKKNEVVSCRINREVRGWEGNAGRIGLSVFGHWKQEFKMVNVHRLASKGLRSAATQRERPRKRVALSHMDVVLCLFDTASHIPAWPQT